MPVRGHQPTTPLELALVRLSGWLWAHGSTSGTPTARLSPTRSGPVFGPVPTFGLGPPFDREPTIGPALETRSLEPRLLEPTIQEQPFQESGQELAPPSAPSMQVLRSLLALASLRVMEQELE